MFDVEDRHQGELVGCPVCGKAVEAQAMQTAMVPPPPTGVVPPPSRGVSSSLPVNGIEASPLRPTEPPPQKELEELSLATRLWLFLCERVRACFSFGGFVVFIALCAITLGYLGFSDADGSDKIAKMVREKDLPAFFQNKDFIYFGGVVKDLKLKKNDNRLYTGDVTFSLEGQTLVRPISVRINENREFEYGVDFDYAQHDDYLEEDAKLIMSKLLKASNIKAKILKTHVVSPGVFEAVIQHDGIKEKVKIRVRRKGREFFYETIQ